MNGDEPGADRTTEPPRPAVSTVGLLRGGLARLRERPRVLGAFLLAGLVVAGVDALRRGDPVPTLEFVGLQSGQFSVRFGAVPRIYARTSTPLGAVYALRPNWLVRVAGLELLQGAAVVGAGIYGIGRLLDTRAGMAGIARYAGVFALLSLAVLQVDAGLFLGVPLFILFFVVLVRVVALPAFLVRGDSLRRALGRAWGRTRGHGWAVFGVVVVVGFANHALASVPVAGPVGSGLAAALQAGVLVAFVQQTDPPGGP